VIIGVRCCAATVGLILAFAPRVAYAQRFEVSGGFAWSGGYGLGSAAANETRNPSTGSGPLTLFQTSSRVTSAAGADIRAGVYVTSHLVASAVLQIGSPTLRTHATADFEGASEVDAETSVSSYLIAGEVEYRMTVRRWALFATGGAGQLREVPEQGDVLTAAEIHAGGGIRHLLTHGRHPLGVRGDVVASYRSRTLNFDQRHVTPRATVGLTYRF
jgi:hypothetical protein